MAQLTVYIDDDTLRRIGVAAEEEGCSVSRWVKHRLVAALDAEWPSGFFDLFGALDDVDIERPPQPQTPDVEALL